jgi:hypothetical protein
MRDDTSTNVGLGYMDPKRMEDSYRLFEPYLEKPFDINKHFTNEFVDTSVKMPAN